MDFMKYFGWYLAAVNIVAFIMYGIDKEKARRGAWRIPESTLTRQERRNFPWEYR